MTGWGGPERRREGKDFRGSWGVSGWGGGVVSLSGDAGAENRLVVDESPWWITSQAERGISSRLTRSVAACER